MNRLVKLFCYTLLVSFLGSLPLGTLNVSVTQLVLQKGWAAAILFSAGAISVELVLVRIAVAGVDRLNRVKKFVPVFHHITLLVLLLFSAVSIKAAIGMETFRSTRSIVSEAPFAAGLLLSALNPLHLPFWLGWTASFKTKRLLQNGAGEYNVYFLGIGLGTALGFLLYGWLSSVLVNWLNDYQFLFNWVVGLFLFATAVLHSKHIWRRKVIPLNND